jgi:hypothetical protein
MNVFAFEQILMLIFQQMFISCSQSFSYFVSHMATCEAFEFAS